MHRAPMPPPTTMPRAALAALLMAFALTALAPDNAVAQTLTVDALDDDTIAENTTYVSAAPGIANTEAVVGVPTWTLGGVDADDFTIDSGTGMVTLSLPNFEVPTDIDMNNTYQFTVTATDQNTPQNTGTSAVITVTVTDAIEAATFTVPALASENIPENTTYTSATPVTSGGTPIGALTWTLGGDDAAQFIIDADTGIVTLNPLDFEALLNDYDYAFTLTATDADGNTGTYANNAVTTITITDVGFTVALADATIDENMTYTSTLPSIAGTHCEVSPLEEGVPTNTLISGLTFTWSLGGDDDGEFTIDADTGIVTLSPRDYANPTDSDSDNTYQFTVTATATADDNCAATSDDTTITIIDVGALVYTGTFTETAANDGTVEGSITATLSGDTFATDVVSHVSVTGVPTGLTAEFTRVGDGVVTLTLTGNADSHESTDNVSNLTITFGDAAFVNESAGNIGDEGATHTTGITFRDAEPAVEQTPFVYRLLPEVARAITDSTVTAITQRMDESRTNPASGTLVLGGQTTLADMLTTSGRALAAGTLDLTNMLRRSAFVLPLNAQRHGLTNMTFWGNGNYRAIGGGNGNGDPMDWDGALFTGRIGMDTRVQDALLAGAAVSWTHGALDYSALTGTAQENGDATITLATVQPYLSWNTPDKGLALWSTAGYGWGDLTITSNPAGQPTRERASDITSRNVGGGISGQILETVTSQLRLKGEMMQTWLAVEGSGDLPAATVESRRVRVSLAGTTTKTLADGARLTPTAEVGMRHDAGDGRTGIGAEVGGGLRYAAPVYGITLESQSRILLGHTGDYDDWGVGGMVMWRPGQGGQGLAFRLEPTYGQTATQTTQLWDQGAMDLTGTNAAALGQRLDAEVGYGLTALDGRGLLTPYSKMTWGQGVQAYRLGSRLTLASGLTMSFEGVRGETVGATAPEHHLQWQTGWRWLTASMQTSGAERRVQLQAKWEW